MHSQLDEERKQFKSTTDAEWRCEGIKVRTDRHGMILLLLTRQRQRRQAATPAGTPRKKVWRRVYPSPEVEYAWRHVQQNSSAWYDARAGSSGASSLHRLMGWDDYRTSSCVWMEDTGLVAEPERSIDENLPLDEGHDKEHVGREWTMALLDIDIQETGLWLHPNMPFAHASPDGIVCWAQAALGGGRGLWEHKLTIFGLLFNKKGVAHWGFPMKAKPMHVIQMQAQMACVGPAVQWTLYTNLWHFHEMSGLKPMPAGPFSYEGPASACGAKPRTPGCWIVASILISMFWRAPRIIDQMYKLLVQHMRRVGACFAGLVLTFF